MDLEHFLAHVREHLGPADGSDLDAAVNATLEALGAMVGPARRAAVSRALPPPLGESLIVDEYDPSLGREALVERVARSEHVPPGRALEHATAVLRALAVTLDPDLRRVLSAELPEDVQPWLEPPPSGAPARPLHPPRESPHRLSDAQPGSRHPVSEAELPAGQLGSVARERDPHADTRLSSARGLTQEREHETVAEGHPGFEHTVGETE